MFSETAFHNNNI